MLQNIYIFWNAYDRAIFSSQSTPFVKYTQPTKFHAKISKNQYKLFNKICQFWLFIYKTVFSTRYFEFKIPATRQWDNDCQYFNTLKFFQLAKTFNFS